ncbi:MAG: UDP-N-acetylmuramate--L-alanine ligase [Chitinivibrionales bacterium]
MFQIKRKIHFIGIGGAGMSPLAHIMHRMGHIVTGSDRQLTPVTERLEDLGIRIQSNHNPDLITHADLVVYSSAISPDNPEMVYAKDHEQALIRRAEMLGDLMRARFSIGIAGTHGKTTTTALTGHILTHAGEDPMVIVGGTLLQRKANAVPGSGPLLVTEADEYDRSFLSMYPSVAVITNIEADHLDCYGSIDQIEEAFLDYTHRVPFFGAVVICIDDPRAAGLIPRIKAPVVTYGTSSMAQFRAKDVHNVDGGMSFILTSGNDSIGTFTVPLFGMHNVRNALAAITIALNRGLSVEKIQQALAAYEGVHRRFEVVGTQRGVTVIDDYAHHPSEIAATLAAAKTTGASRVVAVFQPHLYTRTRDFLDEFALSLSAADKAIITSIYKAREEPLKGVSAAQIAERMRANGYEQVAYIENKDAVVEYLAPLLSQGDMVVLMGAGDINTIGQKLLQGVVDG